MNNIRITVESPRVLQDLNAQFPDRYPFLLQSTVQGGSLGRYDILFAYPDETLSLSTIGCLDGPHGEGQNAFLEALSHWWEEEQTTDASESLPFRGGWFLYLGYELAEEIEPSLTLQHDPALPVAFAVRCKHALVFDHESQRCQFVTEEGAQSKRRELQQDIEKLATRGVVRRDMTKSVDEDDAAEFIAAVEATKQHIAAGDVYQANLSREWRAALHTQIDAADIYRALSKANPAPFAGIAHWQRTSIVSSSPERLLEIRNGRASTRPIAGTRPRGEHAQGDASLSAELFAHPKERAEHIMLIDLERNDLGRICEPGSVTVDEMMVLESYAHVHHIVSNVRGELRPGTTPGEAIAAVFPGGTITGCPKVRCMQLINDKEIVARGAYTGSMGYLNRNGDMDLNILIRTIVKSGDALSFRAGAGIVADSDPDAEVQETRAKAKGMLEALRGGTQA